MGLIHARYNDIEFDMVGEVLVQSSSSLLKAKIGALKSYLNKDKNLLPIIIAEYLSSERREQCREQGIFYIDLSGNIYIKHKGIYVEREGFPDRVSPFSFVFSFFLWQFSYRHLLKQHW